MKMYQKIQLESLESCRRGDGWSLSGPVTSAGLADELLATEGACRHRLLRYAQKGWLRRAWTDAGWRYEITPRGLARLNWLKEQRRPKGLLDIF